jgi:hypothetical protein
VSQAGRVWATALVVLVAAGIAGYAWFRGVIGPVLVREHCTARVGDTSVDLELDQAENTATIAAVAERRGLPARAVTIALATAYQESDLHNVDYGDRDSLGLFQQRPSQGWGTAEQILDPVHSASRFYDALVKIPNYHELPITVAAQRVQRSANGNAYADHEPEARVLASSLTGNSPAAFSCSIRPDHYPAQTEEADGLVPRARVVRDELTANFAGLQVGGYQPGGVDSGHVDGSAHYDGRALDVFFRDYGNPQVRPAGWVVAHWLVANADRLGVATVIYDDHIWTARRSTSGWRPYTPPDGPTDDATLRHLDHVHVDVVRGS